MKKRIASFAGGFFAALALAACLTTALAAAGKVSYNFANVCLDGGTVIVAGADISAANGQMIPGSILYTDETGGKTNYLPLRKISSPCLICHLLFRLLRLSGPVFPAAYLPENPKASSSQQQKNK